MISKGFLSASQFLLISKISSTDGSEFNHLLSSPEIQGYKIGKSLGISIGNEFTNTLQSTQFSSIWRTSNISTDSSAANQVTLPLVSTGTYNFEVNWGDGTSDTITTWNQAQRTHTYTLEGIYDITITGTIIGFSFFNGTTGVGLFSLRSDRLKLLSIRQWGTNFRLGDNAGYFWGCSNLDLSIVRDVLDLTGTTNWGSIFRDCFNITTINRINEWNTSNITNMGGVFLNCFNFNQDIGNWNTSNVIAMNQMFQCVGLTGIFNQNIGNWNTSKVTTITAMFQNQPNFNQDISTKVVTIGGVTYTAWDTLNVTNMSSLFISVTIGSFNQNIGNWNTSKVTLMNSMFSGQISFNQDVGTKVVTVNGVTYTAWDVSNVTNMSFMFNAFLNTANTSGVFNNGGSDSIKNWNTTKVTTLQAFCQRQSLFNQDVGTKVVTVGVNTYTAWDTGNVTTMSNAFSSSLSPGAFNNGGSDSIKNWNISKVTTLNATFANQTQFNQDISTKRVTVGASTYTAWDTLNVTIMTNTISMTGNGVFNQNIGNWNTSKVTNMSTFAFNQPNFNQDLSTKVVTVGPSTYTAWDTLNVTNMSFMFSIVTGQGQFNQNIGNWNTSKVTTISTMFQNQPNFNQDLSTKVVTVGVSTYTAWNTSEVTNMAFVFNMSAGFQGQFNQNIVNWNTSKVTTVTFMFANQPAFNQNISTKTVTVGASTYTAWDTLNVTLMGYMFYNNIVNSPSQFNQNIGNWNTIKVTDMTAMLFNTGSFNQNISSWNVSLVTVFNGTGAAIADTFADGIGLSTTNYDALLIGWASRSVLPNIAINFGTIKHTSAATAAKSVLTSAPNNWTIVDGGLL